MLVNETSIAKANRPDTPVFSFFTRGSSRTPWSSPGHRINGVCCSSLVHTSFSDIHAIHTRALSHMRIA